jgi:hypothetical protein
MNGEEEDKDYGMTISSYFLMESDIRGQVYKPSYYFNPENSKRLEHLNNLLLTQGWRDFIWKSLSKPKDSITYKAEKGFTISGKVKQVFGQKPIVNNNITLGLVNKHGFNAFSATTDTLGRFDFKDVMFFGKTNLYLNSRDDKGKFKGKIVMDSIERSPMYISLKKEQIILPQSTNTVVENVIKKFTGFDIKPENVLKEIEVKALKNKVNPWYGVPDYSYVVDRKEANEYYNFVDYLNEKLRGIVAVNSVEMTGKDISELPFAVLIDGFEAVHSDQLFSVSLDEALKIEVVSGIHIGALYGKNTVISIITSSKKGNTSKKVFHSIKQEIEGFYEARTFYAPNPEEVNQEPFDKKAARNTIYWNPYVHPEKTGNVSYYNTNMETKVKVVMEGITDSGTPIVINKYYFIKKQ